MLSFGMDKPKERQTQHYFLSKTLERQFDLLLRLSVTTAKFCCRKFAFAAMLGNCDSKILPTKFLVSSEDCIRDLTNRHRLFSIQVAEYTSFSHQARKLKTNLSSLVSNFSKYYCKTGTICLLFLSSYIFTTLEFDMNHFGILL